MNSICHNNTLTGPFDDCLRCQFLGNGCSGPRTNCMTHDRYIEWLKDLKKLRGYTNQNVADGAGLSLATVNDIFAGRRKDITRTTAGLLEDFLIGNGKWPCAMKLAEGKDVVYEDRPATLEALRVRTEQVENLRRHLDEFKGIMDKEVSTVRTEYEDDVAFFKTEIAFCKDQIRRKDEYIDYLVKKNNGDLK